MLENLQRAVEDLKRGAGNCNRNFRSAFSSVADKAADMMLSNEIEEEEYFHYTRQIDEAVQSFSKDCDCGI